MEKDTERDLDHAYLLSRLDYCPLLGLFWWKPRDNVQWNAKFAGKVAGSRDRWGYARIKLDYKTYRLHRLAWFYVHGDWPSELVDHKNGMKLDNALSNLRDATPTQNGANTKVYSAHGFKGATKVGKKWMSQLKHNGKTHYLGVFPTAEQAHTAYMAKAIEIHGEFARAR